MNLYYLKNICSAASIVLTFYIIILTVYFSSLDMFYLFLFPTLASQSMQLPSINTYVLPLIFC